MNKFSLEKLFTALQSIQLTQSEKSFLRLQIAGHMRRNPIGSRVSFFSIRYMVPAALTLVLFLGTGGLVTFASQGTLPGDTLYKVKRASEEVKRVAILDHEARVAYELALIDKRFSETNQLITEKKLTPDTETLLASAINQHAQDFNKDVAKIADADPVLALSYNAKLTNTLKTGTHILLALSERQTDTDRSTPNVLVLAAYATAEKVAQEKQSLEPIVLSDENVATVKTAEKRYTETLALLAKQDIIPKQTTDTLATAATFATIEPMPMLAKTSGASVATKMIATEPAPETATLMMAAEPVDTKVTVENDSSDLQKLANALQEAYDAKHYRQVITIAEQIDQILHEAQKIQEVEKTLNVKISNDPVPPNSETTNSTEKSTSVKQ